LLPQVQKRKQNKKQKTTKQQQPYTHNTPTTTTTTNQPTITTTHHPTDGTHCTIKRCKETSGRCKFHYGGSSPSSASA
jgi:hypothetical protein